MFHKTQNHMPRTRPGGWSFGALMRDLVTAWRLLWDPAVPGLLKVCVPFLAFLYFIWPLDLMPGLPFDDILVTLLASRLFIHLAPQDRVNQAAPGGYSTGSSHSQYDDQYDDRRNGYHAHNRANRDEADVIDTTWHVVDE